MVEIAVEAFLQLHLADDRDALEISVAGDVVAMRLGVDEITDRRLFLHHFAPAHGIHGDLGQVDHDIAVAGLDEAGIAPAKIDFREAVPTDPAHETLPAVLLTLILPNSTRRNRGPGIPYAIPRIFAPDQRIRPPVVIGF